MCKNPVSPGTPLAPPPAKLPRRKKRGLGLRLEGSRALFKDALGRVAPGLRQSVQSDSLVPPSPGHPTESYGDLVRMGPTDAFQCLGCQGQAGVLPPGEEHGAGCTPAARRPSHSAWFSRGRRLLDGFSNAPSF